MKELTLYSPVKIDSYAFVSCNSLETINYFGYPLGLDCNSSFNKVYVEGITLRVPHNMKNFFKEVIGWKNFGIIEEVDSINLIQPQAIDLGLSVKWSSFNLGAQSPEQYGMYVAWGELFPKGNYDWSSYKWCDNVASSLTKYNSDESKGVVDNKLVLDMSDDAANYFLGGNWRIPTFEEISELANNNNCTWTWVCQNGVNGYMVTSKKDGYTDQSIFLPATGLSVGSGRSLTGSNARYWSSSRVISESQNAYMLWFSSGDHGSIQDARDVGFTIRPVCP